MRKQHTNKQQPKQSSLSLQKGILLICCAVFHMRLFCIGVCGHSIDPRPVNQESDNGKRHVFISFSLRFLQVLREWRPVRRAVTQGAHGKHGCRVAGDARRVFFSC
jgi:hypothetical protein